MPSEVRDPDLVRRVRLGDRDAFAALVDRHAGLLRATTRRAATADAAQEAVLTDPACAGRRDRDDGEVGRGAVELREMQHATSFPPKALTRT
jgi:hypothetical protein